MRLLLCLALLFQSAEITKKVTDGDVFLTIKSTATDDTGEKRKVQFLGRLFSGKFDSTSDVVIRVAVKKTLGDGVFNAELSAKCGNRSLFSRPSALHNYIELDAETFAVYSRITYGEAVEMSGCALVSLTIGGIDVTFSKEQLQPLRDVLARMKTP